MVWFVGVGGDFGRVEGVDNVLGCVCGDAKESGPQGLKPFGVVERGRAKAKGLAYLDVISQEVVVIENCSADGWLLVETGVRPVPVVLVGPCWKRSSAVC